jgi:integrase
VYLAAVLTGAREGELLGLTWDRIDWPFSRASIAHTLVRFDHRIELLEPKSRRSWRTIALPPVLLEALQRERDDQKRYRKLYGDAYRDMNLVFCQRDGKPLHAHNLTQRDFREVATRAKVPHIRFHDLRHCCATMLLRQGVHPKVVGEQLGHASIGVTLDTYSHVVPGMMEEAATQLATRLIGGSWR